MIVPKNEARAAHYLEMAAKSGLSAAEYTFGEMTQKKSPQMAVEWFLKASKHECAAAQCQLAKIYKEGFGVERNLAQALFWANVATAQSPSFSKSKGFWVVEASLPGWDLEWKCQVNCGLLRAELEKLLPEDIKARVQEASSNWRPGGEVALLQVPDLPQLPKQQPPVTPVTAIAPMKTIEPRGKERADKQPQPPPSELRTREARPQEDQTFKLPGWKSLM